ncbi:zinc ribbon domain-containing protein [Natronoglomus mannanivorans]|uniref:Zinc ribbon domain-containing protein n=1 Tax=Natronoglomus mannanivorans TaxID=2979990 RepID=A0AAP2YV99_9EURY|nr:zinc ribbon domain-containing protein [Halobacteria archaeon AArc-xg1-1]
MGENYCRNCGTQLDPDARFCSECGTEVSEDTTAGFESRSESAVDTYGDSINRFERGTRTEGDTTFAALTHILALVTWVIGPLIVLVVTEDEFVEENARNALNWQIAFTVYMLVSFVLLFLFVGIVFLLVLPVVDVILCIVAAVKASEGDAWRYPLTPSLV